MGADILTAHVGSTTHAGGKRGRHIDDFVVSGSVASVGPKLSICADAVIRTHDAVRLRMLVEARRFNIRGMVRPSNFPRELPVGPRQVFDTPNEVVCTARAAQVRAEHGDKEAASILINEATLAIIDHLEETLVEAYMIGDDDREKFVGRRNGVRYVIGPLLEPKAGKHGRSTPTVRRLRLLQDRAAAVAASADRQWRRLTGGTGHPTGTAEWHRSWIDLLERGRAAISSGHHVAATDGRSNIPVQVISAKYANDLKVLGKWVERWALYYTRGDTAAGLNEGIGWRSDDTTLPEGRDGSHPGTVLPGGDYAWLQELSCWAGNLANEVKDVAEPSEAAHRAEVVADVRRWATEASENGAAVAHRWTKVPEDWRPEAVGSRIDGIANVTADPGAVVEQERAKWEALWRPSGGRLEEL